MCSYKSDVFSSIEFSGRLIDVCHRTHILCGQSELFLIVLRYFISLVSNKICLKIVQI